MLRNAIHFTTGQRAFPAFALLNQPFGELEERALPFLAVDAFSAEMTSTEDVFGWFFVLRDWKPGSAATSVFLVPELTSDPSARQDREIDRQQSYGEFICVNSCLSAMVNARRCSTTAPVTRQINRSARNLHEQVAKYRENRGGVPT